MFFPVKENAKSKSYHVSSAVTFCLKIHIFVLKIKKEKDEDVSRMENIPYENKQGIQLYYFNGCQKQ